MENSLFFGELVNPKESWVGLLPATKAITSTGQGSHEWTPETLQTMVENFEENAYGLLGGDKPVLAVNFNHAKGQEAAGWIKELKVEDGVLSGLIQWTKLGQEAVDTGEYRYVSAEATKTGHLSNRTGQKYSTPVLTGAGLTNAPFYKQLSEIKADVNFDEKEEVMAEEVQVAQAPEQAQVAAVQEKFGVVEEARLLQQPDLLTATMQIIAMLDEAGKAQLAASLGQATAPAGVQKPMEVQVETLKASEDTEKELKSQILDLTQQLGNMQRNLQFTELLTAGKAVAAQREAFVAGDVLKFAEGAMEDAVMFTEQGKAVGSDPGKGKTVHEEISERASVYVEQGVPFKDAVEMVFTEDPDLENRFIAEDKKEGV